jgi:hypothetical protein
MSEEPQYDDDFSIYEVMKEIYDMMSKSISISNSNSNLSSRSDNTFNELEFGSKKKRSYKKLRSRSKKGLKKRLRSKKRSKKITKQ